MEGSTVGPKPFCSFLVVAALPPPESVSLIDPPKLNHNKGLGVQGPELAGLSGNRTSVSLPPRELEGLCCQQMAMGKNCCSMYQLADDSSPAVHTSVPVSLSENTAPLTQSNRHPEAEDEQEERQWDTCSQCGVYRLFSRLSDEACMQQQGIACDFAGDKPRNPDLIDPWRLTAEMLARYWAEQAADSSGSD